MTNVYENDNREIDMKKMKKAKSNPGSADEEKIRRKARDLKQSILAKKKAAS